MAAQSSKLSREDGVIRMLLPALLLLAVPIQARPVDIGVLQSVICSWETRGEDEPDEVRGPSGEIGRCQILLATAEMVKCKVTAQGLAIRRINERCARKVLSFSFQRGHRRPVTLAYAYNGGHYSPFGAKKRAYHYARIQAVRYAEAMRRKQWRRMYSMTLAMRTR